MNALEAVSIHGRGRPQQICWTHLWSRLLLCALPGMNAFADGRRFLGWQQLGPFPLVWLTRNDVIKRLLQAGLPPLQERWERLNARLAQTCSWAVSARFALCANAIFALDETLRDAVGRYLKPLRGVSTHEPACFAGQLVRLFDLRRQRWARLEWRKDVHENCRVDLRDVLQGLSAGSVLLFDLG